MLLNSPLDLFGQALAALMVIGLGRAIWLDTRWTAIVRRTIPDTYSRDPRKWSYIREHRFDPEIWPVHVELCLLGIFSSGGMAFIAFRYLSSSQHDRSFGWMALGGTIVGLGYLGKSVIDRRR